MKASNPLEDGRKTVLVVEDNPDDMILLQTAAEETCPDIGFRFVRDGFSALAYLKGEGEYADRREHPLPEVVVLDVRLPIIDGFEALELIRQVRHCDGLKVMVWSDTTSPAVWERARTAGVDYFFAKPFSYHKLLEEVRRICQWARGEG